MAAGINDTMLIPVVPAAPHRIFSFFVACCALSQVEMQLGNSGSSRACVGVIVTACARRRWTVRAFDANIYAHRAQVLYTRWFGRPPSHHYQSPWSGMSDDWVTGIRIFHPKQWKQKSIGNVRFFSLGRRRLVRLLKCYLFHISHRTRSRSRSKARSRSRSRSRNSFTTTPHPWL